MSRYVVGLTGGIASGKSALGREFEKLGVTVVDADAVARAVVAPGPVLSAIAERFGASVLQPDGHLDRRALRKLVFADDELRRALEAITHPAIRAQLKAACEQAPGDYAIASIPLLTEAGGRAAYPWLDRTLVIDAPRDVQLARVMHRDGIDITLAERMLAAQATREQRLALADDVAVNDGDPQRLTAAAARLDALYREQARRKA